VTEDPRETRAHISEGQSGYAEHTEIFDDMGPTEGMDLHEEQKPLSAVVQPSASKENTEDVPMYSSPIPEAEDSPSPETFILTRRRAEKRKTVDSVVSNRDKKRAREGSDAPDEDHPGQSSSITRRKRDRPQTVEDKVASKRFQTVIGMLHSQISAHRNGNIFHNPIKPSEAPDYHEIVKRPIDLKTIKAKIKEGGISNSLEFQRDIYLMFANALMYNRPNSDIYIMTEEMMLESEKHINAFRQTEGFTQRTQRV